MKFLKWLSELTLRIAIKTDEFVIKPIFWFLDKLIMVSSRALIAFIMLCALMTLIMKAPTFHHNMIRSYVGSNVYYVYPNGENEGGATAFAIRAPSGKSYLITNDHVCVNAKTDTALILSDKDDFKFLVNIIARSATTDLCLLGSPFTDQGLNIAEDANIGDRVQVVGHPNLMPITVSNIGEIIGTSSSSMTDSINSIKCDTQNAKYRISIGPNGKAYCVVTIPNVFRTTVLIQPGNSGSPLVNFYGDVVGVVSGLDNYGWAIVVDLNDVKEFLHDK